MHFLESQINTALQGVVAVACCLSCTASVVGDGTADGTAVGGADRRQYT